MDDGTGLTPKKDRTTQKPADVSLEAPRKENDVTTSCEKPPETHKTHETI